MTDEPSEPTRGRFSDARFVTFLVLGAVLIALAIGGFFSIDRQTDITAEEAVEIARPLIDFEPVNEGARFIRQGAQLRPVWAVSFSIPGGGARDFERLTTVEVDAVTGDVIRIAIDDPDEE